MQKKVCWTLNYALEYMDSKARIGDMLYSKLLLEFEEDLDMVCGQMSTLKHPFDADSLVLLASKILKARQGSRSCSNGQPIAGKSSFHLGFSG